MIESSDVNFDEMNLGLMLTMKQIDASGQAEYKKLSDFEPYLNLRLVERQYDLSNDTTNEIYHDVKECSLADFK